MSNIIGGGQATLTIGTSAVGYAGGVNGGQDIAYQPVDTIGNLYPREQVPVGITIRFACNFFRILTERYSDCLRVTDDRGDKGKKYLIQQGIQAFVENRITEGSTFITASGLKLATRNFDTAARTLFTENATFVGIALDFHDGEAAV